jgi:predicted kinase
MVKLFYLCGLPGSGKSQWAETHKDELNAVVHSSDSIRAELLNDENDQSKNELVFKILHQRIKDDLRAGKNVVYDATNLNRCKRIHFLNNELRDIPCNKICVLFAVPWEMCLARNFTRDRQVPEEVMSRMYKSFSTPTVYEGWSEVRIVWAEYKNMLGFEYDICVDMEKWKRIDHNNPHHHKSIGNHMLTACDYIKDRTNDVKLISAALLHDIGKPDVKAFINSKGEPCDIAHYYNHENIGSYKALFYLRNMHPDWSDMELLYVSLLINMHMRPHSAWKQSDKAKDKDRRLFGDDIIKSLELLNEADIYAQ